jgi:hypothetical protein
MSFYERRSYSDGQIMFNRILFSFVVVFKTILKIIVYSPLLFLSYLITKQILSAQTEKIIWLALMLIFAFVLYAVIYFFKGVLVALKFNHKSIWILLFICLVTTTCILAVWIIFNPLQDFINNYTSSNQQLVTWLFALAFGLYVYSKYQFLTNIAPNIAFPYYQMGINSAVHSLNLADTFKAKKSQETI